MTWGWWAAFWSGVHRGDKRFPLAGHVPPEPHHLAGRHQQVSGYISGGPNFAYDLCIRKITDEQRATLDLSSWALAFVGAEPIEPGTLERFAAAFAPCGFKPGAFYPCYGLAEATLIVSGSKPDSGATVGAFHGPALTRNRVEPVPNDAPQARRLVACGSPVGDLPRG